MLVCRLHNCAVWAIIITIQREFRYVTKNWHFTNQSRFLMCYILGQTCYFILGNSNRFFFFRFFFHFFLFFFFFFFFFSFFWFFSFFHEQKHCHCGSFRCLCGCDRIFSWYCWLSFAFVDLRITDIFYGFFLCDATRSQVFFFFFFSFSFLFMGFLSFFSFSLTSFSFFFLVFIFLLFFFFSFFLFFRLKLISIESKKVKEKMIEGCGLLLSLKCLSTFVYSIVLLAMKDHLFVWTVFSPKFIYDVFGIIVCFLCLFLMFVVSASFELLFKDSHKKIK